jgi:hypothetical protein
VRVVEEDDVEVAERPLRPRRIRRSREREHGRTMQSVERQGKAFTTETRRRGEVARRRPMRGEDESRSPSGRMRAGVTAEPPRDLGELHPDT